MNTLNVIWNWFDGKKTNIGAVCLLLVTFISQVVIGIWKIDPAWLDMTSETLTWIGGVLVPAGLAHQVQKALKPEPSNEAKL